MSEKQKLQSLLMNVIAGLNSVGYKDYNHISWEISDSFSVREIQKILYHLNEKINEYC